MPVKWQHRIVATRNSLVKEFANCKIGEADIAKAIAKLLRAEKRELSYDDGVRATARVPDTNAIRHGVEILA